MLGLGGQETSEQSLPTLNSDTDWTIVKEKRKEDGLTRENSILKKNSWKDLTWPVRLLQAQRGGLWLTGEVCSGSTLCLIIRRNSSLKKVWLGKEPDSIWHLSTRYAFCSRMCEKVLSWPAKSSVCIASLCFDHPAWERTSQIPLRPYFWGEMEKTQGYGSDNVCALWNSYVQT